MDIETKSPSLEEIKGNTILPLPPAIANSSFPYTVLHSRRFEDLLYAIFRSELDNGNLDLPFNEIALMSGTQEQGRDCSLYMNGKPVGLIQCKKYGKAIDKLECIDEILKFILNAILYPELISSSGDINYYIAASSGFNNKASEFLSDFAENMLTYTELMVRCEVVKAKYATLKSIDINVELPNINGIISRIKVKPLAHIDLDSYLGKNYNAHLISSFFQVLAVLDKEGSEAVKEITAHIKSGSLKLPNVPVILEKIKDCSSILRSQIRFFGRSYEHIPRAVVEQIRTAINLPHNQESENIFFLSAKAGMGKSVAMCDLLISLEKDNIPVLAIKADKQFGASITELEEKLALPFSIVDALKKLSQEHDKVVLMIDQLDVLSQSFATNKEFLNTIIDLISRLKYSPKIRIIISVRKFDLDHNQDLRILNSSKKRIPFDLVELQPGEVRTVLNTLDSVDIKLSPTLLKLLQTPKNLDVFCLIYHSGIDIGSLNTEYDLYGELWKGILNPKRTANSDKLNITAFTFKFAGIIEQRGVLSLSKAQFETQFSNEIDYLLSQGIFTTSNNELQFFHQTFFDYVLARQFHEENRNLLRFIIAHRNKLNIRSTVRAVMYYSSQVLSDREYLKIAQRVLRSGSVTYNLKLVVIESIARDSANSSYLHQALERIIIQNDSFTQAFFENLDNGPLYEYAMKNKWADSFLNINTKSNERSLLNHFFKYDGIRIWLARKGKEPFNYLNRLNIIYRLIINKWNYNPESTISWLQNTNAIEQKEQMIFRMLYSFKKWDVPSSFELLTSLTHLLKKDAFETFSILENIAECIPEKAFEIYQKHIFSIQEFQKDIYQYQELTHHESEFIKNVVQKIPEVILSHYLPLIDGMFENERKPTELSSSYYSEMNLLFFSYKKSEYRDNDLLPHLIDASRKCAENGEILFRQLFEKYKTTDSASVLLILTFGLKEKPQHYTEQSFELIKIVHDRTSFDIDGNIGSYFRKFLQEVFSFFSFSQQKQIVSWILQIHPEDDKKSYEHGGKKHYPKWAGNIKLKFLQSIPDEKIVLFADARREFEELKRKFTAPINDEPSEVRTYSMKPPLPKKAYEKMSLDNWKNSFLKYSADTEREFGSDKGGLTQHANAFTEEVVKRPDFFYDFIFSLSDVNNTSFEYSISGLEGLIKGEYSSSKIRLLFSKLISRPTDRYETKRLIWHSEYLITKSSIDTTLLNFLITQAQHNDDPTPDDKDISPIQRGINSVRGSAIDKLMVIARDEKYYNQVLPIIESATNDFSPAVRATILNRLGLLIKSDRKKAYYLFQKLLTNNPHPEFWKISVSTAQYLVYGHYNEMEWYFLALLTDESLSKFAVRILVQYHIWNDEDCMPMMKIFFEKYPSTIPDLILFLDSGLVSNENIPNSKAIQLYWSFLHLENNKVADSYNTNMLHLKPEHFDHHKKYLLAFSKSYSGKHCYYYLWHYLIKCVIQHPLECLEIVNNYTISDFDSLDRDYVDEYLIRLIMAIHSQLSKTETTDGMTKKINKVLDRVLLSEKYRRSISKTLVLSEE